MKAPTWLSKALFVINDDQPSVDWLKHHSAVLQQLDATGIVLNVEHQTDLKALQRQSPLPLVPAQAPSLVAMLRAAGVTVYPVAVMPDGLVVQDLSAYRHGGAR